MNQDNPANGSGRLKPIWIPTEELQSGMVIAESLLASSGGYATLKLSPGAVVSEETITQLLVKGVECVAVVNRTPLTEPDYQLAVQRYEARLHEIFGSHPSEDCQALMEALLSKGPTQWT